VLKESGVWKFILWMGSRKNTEELVSEGKNEKRVKKRTQRVSLN
jgi:hypothetical protein